MWLSLVSLGADRRSEGQVLAAGAFTNEPFMVDLAGDKPVDRLSAALEHYRAMPWTEDVQLGAFVDDVLIGVCLCSVVDRCLICTRDDLDGAPPDDDERRLGLGVLP